MWIDTACECSVNEVEKSEPTREAPGENLPEEEHIDDPEIEAWLNAGSEGEKEEKEVTDQEEVKEEEIPEGTEGVTTIENHSEVPYHEDPNMCDIGDDVVARILMKQLKRKSGKGEDEDDFMESAPKKKKLNKNSRAYKKQKEEERAAAKKAAEEAAQEAAKEAAAALPKQPVSKYNYERPVKKSGVGLQSLAKKQQSGCG